MTLDGIPARPISLRRPASVGSVQNGRRERRRGPRRCRSASIDRQTAFVVDYRGSRLFFFRKPSCNSSSGKLKKDLCGLTVRSNRLAAAEFCRSCRAQGYAYRSGSAQANRQALRSAPSIMPHVWGAICRAICRWCKRPTSSLLLSEGKGKGELKRSACLCRRAGSDLGSPCVSNVFACLWVRFRLSSCRDS